MEYVVNRLCKVTPRKVMYTVFGIFMIVIYVGMGVLLLLNFFRWEPNWAWIRYTAAGMFILYGIWRAYRHIYLLRHDVFK